DSEIICKSRNAASLARQIASKVFRNRILCGRMSTRFKRALWLLVIYGILYLLISPLPEVGANAFGKSAVDLFVPITPALLGLLLLAFSLFLIRLEPGFVSASEVRNKLCVRLC